MPSMSTRKIDVTILVLSAMTYVDRRQAVRDTWGGDLPDNVDLVFLVGGGGGTVERNGDVLTLPCPDSYNELPQKTRWGLLWALSDHPDCQRFIKVDDDTFVHIPRLMEFLAAAKESYIGHPMQNEYPPFASGGAGYVLDRQAAMAIAGGLTDATGPEDLLVSRVLMAAKIPFTPNTRFHPWNTGAPRRDNDLITSHYQKPEMMRSLWATFQDLAIPKIFHWIWVGDKPLPDNQKAWMDTWKKLHPGWQCQLWGNDAMPLANQREYDLARTMAQKADILRYEILHRHGGVYLDTDFEALKNIEPLLWGSQAFSAAEDDHSIAIGIMGATPHHPFFGDLIKHLPASFAAHENIVNATGPGFFTRHCVGRQDVRILKPWQVYPLHWSGCWHGPREAAFCLHHWAHSWREG